MKQLVSCQLWMPKTCVGGSIRMSSSPKVLDLDRVASAVKSPTMIMVIVLCGRVLSEWVLRLLLIHFVIFREKLKGNN